MTYKTYNDFAFVVRFNHLMAFGTLTPMILTHGTVLEVLKGRLQRAVGADVLKARGSYMVM